ncbi:DUF4244 domain-containing protein [Streptomyces liangshanensis]|uniref:DUF4244 domain-containing protein n=1 Tax=Streptomyces liangshanensis TaxID=2717324 RepID=UPI0036DAB323
MRKIVMRMRAGVRWPRRRLRGARTDAGMATTEFAMVTLAAAALAAVLYKVVTGGQVSEALRSVIGEALGARY